MKARASPSWKGWSSCRSAGYGRVYTCHEGHPCRAGPSRAGGAKPRPGTVMKGHVLEANARYRFLTGGPGADIVDRLFREARDAERPLPMSVINWGEVYYTIAKVEGFTETARITEWRKMVAPRGARCRGRGNGESRSTQSRSRPSLHRLFCGRHHHQRRGSGDLDCEGPRKDPGIAHPSTTGTQKEELNCRSISLTSLDLPAPLNAGETNFRAGKTILRPRRPAAPFSLPVPCLLPEPNPKLPHRSSHQPRAASRRLRDGETAPW